jgi:MFS family permease
LPLTKETFSWGYFETFKELFSKRRRMTFLAYAGDGAENIINMVVWPIFIFEILKGNYFQVGVLSSLIVVASISLQFIVGRLGDHGKRNKMLRTGILLYSAGWLIKIFIETAFQIFVVSTYHNLTRIFTRAPFDALYYDKASHEGHFVDEYTVVREMSFSIGAAVSYSAVLIVAPIVGIKWTFILAAVAYLFMNLLMKEDHDGSPAMIKK